MGVKMEYTIQNEKIKLTVTSEGGTMKSIVFLPTGEERQWQGNEFWKSQDVVIFPIIGHAASFTAEGKTCELKSHGIVRYSSLNVENLTDKSITMSLTSSAETLKNYPYGFLFKISYELLDNSIKVTYFVQSKGGVMPFYVGGHPGMYAPNGEAVIEFEREEHPVEYPLGEDKAVRLNSLKRFVANKQFFAECKTLQLGGLSGGSIYARTSDGFTYEYKSDCPLFAFWSNEAGGDYICVEPWWGINDFPAAPRELSLKPFINFDDGTGKTFSYTLGISKD
jgi:aldose 1-epimerase